jgi:diacylglycerol kinase family enzyme
MDGPVHPMNPMKWLAIVNPRSGRHRKEVQLRHALSILERSGLQCSVTEYPGHAEALARAATGFDGLAAVGGDGTLHEVLKGMNLERQCLAVIPAGTGNSLARDLGLGSWTAGIDSIKHQNVISIDLMHVVLNNGGVRWQCWSASTVALGYPAAVAQMANRGLKFLGRFCYPIAAILKTIPLRRFRTLLGDDNGPPQSKLLTGLIVNKTRHLGNFAAFPIATPNDALLHVMELSVGCIKQNIHNLSILSKQYFFDPATTRTARSLFIQMENPQPAMVDGEIYPGITNVTVEVLPGKVRCCSNGR